jgi:hypothetical protein
MICGVVGSRSTSAGEKMFVALVSAKNSRVGLRSRTWTPSRSRPCVAASERSCASLDSSVISSARSPRSMPARRKCRPRVVLPVPGPPRARYARAGRVLPAVPRRGPRSLWGNDGSPPLLFLPAVVPAQPSRRTIATSVPAGAYIGPGKKETPGERRASPVFDHRRSLATWRATNHPRKAVPSPWPADRSVMSGLRSERS